MCELTSETSRTDHSAGREGKPSVGCCRLLPGPQARMSMQAGVRGRGGGHICGCDSTAMEMCMPVRTCEWVAGGGYTVSVAVDGELHRPGWECMSEPG